MAQTEQAATLTEQHQQMQARISARALKAFMVLWPLWAGDESSFGRLVTAAMPLVRVHNQMSAAAAAAYYKAFRTAEQIAGVATPVSAGPVDVQQIVKSMFVTGNVMTRNALAAGRTPTEARQAALTRVSGAVTRHVLDGGRDAVLNSVAADKQALGWARVTDGNPCYFCLALASRGAVYKTEQTASFEAHDHCGCTAEVVYEGAPMPPLTAQWKSIYNAAQRDALASGDLQHGENSSKARLNAVRRHLVANPI